MVSRRILPVLCMGLSFACSDPDPASQRVDLPTEPGDGDGHTDAEEDGDGDAQPVEPRPDEDAGEEVVPTLDFSEFDRAIEDFIADEKLQGASAVVVHGKYGQVHQRGYADYAADRLYLIASTSKILSVGVMLRLADQGLLDFDEPISTYLAEWGKYKENITLAQMFSNSSGMIGLTDNPIYARYLCQYMTVVGTLAECAKMIYATDDQIDLKTPDTEFHYGGGQWQLAGGIGEVMAKKKWSDLVAETYIEPCGAATLAYTNQYQQATLSTLGTGAVSYPDFFSGDPSTLPMTDNPSVEGGAYIAAEDYGKILLMHLRKGLCGSERVLSEAAVQRMQTDRIGEVYQGKTSSEVLQGYGLGWWIDRENRGVVVDPGAYGAVSYLDVGRNYGVFIAVQAGNGTELFSRTKPALDALFQ